MMLCLGLIRASMVHSLRALRCNSELLLNTMQVFIQEPSLDWQENAAKLAENFAPDSEASEVDSLSVSQGKSGLIKL
jgi:DNA-dependent protein kinase catalytic subunit